jgi:hypothetical protein
MKNIDFEHTWVLNQHAVQHGYYTVLSIASTSMHIIVFFKLLSLGLGLGLGFYYNQHAGCQNHTKRNKITQN